MFLLTALELTGNDADDESDSSHELIEENHSLNNDKSSNHYHIDASHHRVSHKACFIKLYNNDNGATLKIYKKSNFDPSQFKLSRQHKYMYVYQKKI